VSDQDLERITQAAIDGATAQFAGGEFAVVVVVREIGGGRLNVGSNVMGGRATMIRTLEEATIALRGSSLIIS
jgi:hypothetical protein